MMDTARGSSRSAPIFAGIRAALPLALPAIPIGILLGVAIRDAPAVDNFAGWSSSWLMVAGAAQFAAVDLLAQGAGVWAAVAAIFMINARHIMYSAAIQERYRSAPLWFKLFGSYLLLDQVFALTGDHAPGHLAEQDLDYQMRYYLGTGVPMILVWIIAIGAGVLLGDVIPAEWEIDFAIPLMFLALMVMSVSNLPGVVAAVVGGSIAVIGRDWPSGTGLLVGAIAGVVLAGGLDWYLNDVRSDSGSDDGLPEPASVSRP